MTSLSSSGNQVAVARPGIAHTIADFVAQSAQREPTEDQLAIVKCAVLDWVAVTIAGSGSDVVSGLKRSLSPHSAAGLGAEAAPHETARVLATAGHVLDYDDVLPSIGHPTNTILPAVFALSQSKNMSGSDLVAAYIAALDAEARIGQLLGPEHYAAGFHSTATIGVFGSAIAAAVVHGATSDELVRSLGLASLSASGLKSAFGSWGKSLQVGHAVSEGILAETLVRAGARIHAESFGGEQGFLLTHRGDTDERLMDDVSEAGLDQLLFKYHASCYGTHSAIEGVLHLTQANTIRSIESIDLYISEKHVGMCDRSHATTPLEAKFSLPFAVALAVRFRKVDLETLSTENVTDEATKYLAAKIQLHPERDRDFGATRTIVNFEDGQSAEVEIDSTRPVRGDQVTSRQWPRLVEKFYSLTADLLDRATAEQLVASIENLDNETSIRVLTEAVTRCVFGEQNERRSENV